MQEITYFGESGPQPDGCKYGIELTREMSITDSSSQPVWRMKVSVSDSHNIDPNIFMYLRHPDGRQTFEAMASPVDIEEYPVGTPLSDSSPAFFRSANIDVLARNRAVLDDTWQLLVRDRNDLVNAYVNICVLETDAISRYGEFDDEDVEGFSVLTAKSFVVVESTDSRFPTGTALLPAGQEDGVWRYDCDAVDGSGVQLVMTVGSDVVVAITDGTAAETIARAANTDEDIYAYYNVSGEEKLLRIAAQTQ